MTVYQLWAAGTDYITGSRKIDVHNTIVFTTVEGANRRIEQFRQATIDRQKLLASDPINVRIEPLTVVD